jgi:CRISPR/Cas system endoribonuclease Cas6 (RAMP superfamily)
VKKIERSPDNIFTNNPKSNPNLYLFNMQPVYIQKRSHLQDKNKSSIVLSPSTLYLIPSKNANSQEKQLQSQKKHFERHIEENICSKYKAAY